MEYSQKDKNKTKIKITLKLHHLKLNPSQKPK
jgi:hypothetical protein